MMRSQLSAQTVTFWPNVPLLALVFLALLGNSPAMANPCRITFTNGEIETVGNIETLVREILGINGSVTGVLAFNDKWIPFSDIAYLKIDERELVREGWESVFGEYIHPTYFFVCSVGLKDGSLYKNIKSLNVVYDYEEGNIAYLDMLWEGRKPLYLYQVEMIEFPNVEERGHGHGSVGHNESENFTIRIIRLDEFENVKSPVAGLPVSIREQIAGDRAGGELWRGRTDPDGTVRIRRSELPPGNYLISVNAAGDDYYVSPCSGFSLKVVEVEFGSVVLYTIRC